MRKIVIPIIVILALLAGGYYALRSYIEQRNASSLNSLQTMAVERGDLTATVGATGAVRANQTAIIAWQTTGIVEQVSVKVGDRVESGLVLASLKQTSLPQNVILAQADLVNSQKTLDDLKNSQIARAQAQKNLENAKKALDDQEEKNSLAAAQALDALVKAQQVYSNTLEIRQNMDFAADSPLIRDARANYEKLVGLVTQLRKIYNSTPGDPRTNPEKARALFNLQRARFQLEQAKRLLDLYGGEPTSDQLKQADANLVLAEAKLVDAQLAYDRLKGGPSLAENTLLEAQLADAQRAYERVKDGPDPDDIAAVEARIAAAQATLDMIKLSAPFAGEITDVNVKPGDQATPGTIAFRLDDLSHRLVDVQVSEVDINRIKVGQPSTMSFDAVLNIEYHGKVIEVAQVGNATQGVVEFTATVELTDADQAVKPGMTAAVNIVVDQLKDVLLIPNRAVRVQNGQRVVYALRDGQLVSEQVSLGSSSDSMSEVQKGNIQVGDRIVLNPPQTFETNGPPSFMRR